MTKNLPLAILAVGLLALATALMHAVDARTHQVERWLGPLSLAFTGIGLLAVVVALKLREHGARIRDLERRFGGREYAASPHRPSSAS